MTTATALDRIGVGIDTARYGHRVSFLRPDLQPAAQPLTVTEDRAGYQALRHRLEQLRRQHPLVHFHVRIDAAGQYADNLEQFLRDLDWPMTLSVGEPKRNKDYHTAHSPKRTTDDTESRAMARIALVERPPASPEPKRPMTLLREVAGRLQGQVKQATRAANRLHNLLARTFPELAALAGDITAGWVLRCHEARRDLERLLTAAWDDLPASPHVHVLTIPGIGRATAAVLVAKIADIERFARPEGLVNYFGIFPQEESSGTDKRGQPRPTGAMPMSHKGNDLVRAYLWNAARSAIRHNPAVRALYRRLRARGRRGDVAIGHCMRKLLHLVYAVWKTDRPFDPRHYPWEPADEGATTTGAGAGATTTSARGPGDGAADEDAVGHKRDEPAGRVVTTASSTVDPMSSAVNTAPPSIPVARPRVDFAFLREQIGMEQVLAQLGLLSRLRGGGQQRRGPCPLHSHPGAADRTFSVHLGKDMFRCFHAECGAQGNALDLWGAVHRLPLYEAALHLAETFGLRRNREEEPVTGTRHPL